MSFKHLANYIERTLPTDQTSSKSYDRPFNNGKAKSPPTLRPRGVNRILLFPGSFNPPHQGHLDLLKHVYNNAGEDLNIIAAIIINTDDERLARKMENKDTSIMLPREQRAHLWRGDGIPVDWAWVYDNSEASWAGFQENLVKEIRKDRIDLKFILLFGPDAITAAGGYNPKCWDCPDAITSDISRPVDFRYPNSLRQLAGCTPWERLNYDRVRLEQQIRAKNSGKQDSVVEQELTKAFNKMNVISVCRQQRTKPKGIVRFLPCNLDQRPADPPSSTKIRNIVESSPQEEWEKNLEGVALHPKILVKYLKELPPPVKPVKPAEPKEDTEKEDLEKKRWDNIVW